MASPQFLLDHYEDPYHQGKCEYPTHRGQAKDESCGADLTIELRVSQEGTIVSAWFDGEGCPISLGAASILVEHLEGKSIDAMEEWARASTLQSMLELSQAARSELSTQQQSCLMLAAEAACVAFDSPLDEFEAEGPTLSGPHLGDEC